MTTRAVAAAPPILSDAEITALLRGQGLIADAPQSGVQRMKVDGSAFIAGEEIYTYNAAKRTPAFTARIVGPVVQYQGFYFSKEEAQYASRPEIADRYCKSYFEIPDQARKYSETGASCADCPFGPFVKDPINGRKCQWRGDLELQIVPDSGQLTGEEPIWLLNLSTTGVIEFLGTAREPVKGSVSDFNFIQQLARLGAASQPDNPGKGILRAMTSYHNGGVVGEFRLLGATSADGSRTWRVPSVTPIFFADIEEAPALEAGAPDNAPTNVTPTDSPGFDAELPF